VKAYEDRTYRNLGTRKGLVCFRVVVQETDLWVQAQTRLDALAREWVLVIRTQLDRFIDRHPEFAATLLPWSLEEPAPEIVRIMAAAGLATHVGPMAAVAGAFAELVGRRLLEKSREVIVENGGDIFLKTEGEVTVGVFAGKSPLSDRIGIRFPGGQTPLGVCTSSGTVGHSLSLGKADAVVVVAPSCALADAAATSIGNHLTLSTRIPEALGFARTVPGLRGVMVIMGEKMGVWGDLEVVPLKGKNALSFGRGGNRI